MERMASKGVERVGIEGMEVTTRDYSDGGLDERCDCESDEVELSPPRFRRRKL